MATKKRATKKTPTKGEETLPAVVEPEQKAIVQPVSLDVLRMVNENPLVAYADPGVFGQLQRAARLLAATDWMPQAYKGPNGVANCVGALIVASRMQMTPYEVAQHLNIIHGKGSWGSSFLIARMLGTGRWTEMDWELHGDVGATPEPKDEWGARYYGIKKSDGERQYGPWVTIKIAKAEGWYGRSGSKWQTLPELMLRYRSAAFFARLHAPDTTLGFLTAEELVDAGPGAKAEAQAEAEDIARVLGGAEETIEAEATVVEEETPQDVLKDELDKAAEPETAGEGGDGWEWED